MLSVLLQIFFLLIPTLPLEEPTAVPDKSLSSAYCVHRENDKVLELLKPTTLCFYPNDQNQPLICLPCFVSDQDLLNCTIQEGGYPLCSLEQFNVTSTTSNIQTELPIDSINSLNLKENLISARNSKFVSGYPKITNISKRSLLKEEAILSNSMKFHGRKLLFNEDLSFKAESENLGKQNIYEKGHSVKNTSIENDLNTTENLKNYPTTQTSQNTGASSNQSENLPDLISVTTVKFKSSSMEKMDTGDHMNFGNFKEEHFFNRSDSNHSLVTEEHDTAYSPHTLKEISNKSFVPIVPKNSSKSETIISISPSPIRYVTNMTISFEENIHNHSKSIKSSTFPSNSTKSQTKGLNLRDKVSENSTEENSSISTTFGLRVTMGASKVKMDSSLKVHNLTLPTSKSTGKKYRLKSNKKPSSRKSSNNKKHSPPYESNYVSKKPLQKVDEIRKVTSQPENTMLKNKTFSKIGNSFTLNRTNAREAIAWYNITDSEVKSRSKGNAYLQHNNWCRITPTRRNGILECTIWTHKKLCILSCLKDYEIEGNSSIKMSCEKRKNNWKPKLISKSCKRSGKPKVKREKVTNEQEYAGDSAEFIPELDFGFENYDAFNDFYDAYSDYYAVFNESHDAYSDYYAVFNESHDAFNDSFDAYNDYYDAYSDYYDAFNNSYDTYNDSYNAYSDYYDAFNNSYDTYNDSYNAYNDSYNAINDYNHFDTNVSYPRQTESGEFFDDPDEGFSPDYGVEVQTKKVED